MKLTALWHAADASPHLADTDQFQADIEREQQRIEDELSDYDLWPILQLEFLYRF